MCFPRLWEDGVVRPKLEMLLVGAVGLQRSDTKSQRNIGIDANHRQSKISISSPVTLLLLAVYTHNDIAKIAEIKK